MQCRGALRAPLRNIIKSIGVRQRHRRPHTSADPIDTAQPSLRRLHDRPRPSPGHHSTLGAYSAANATAQQLAEDDASVTSPPEPDAVHQEGPTDPAYDASIVVKKQLQLAKDRSTNSDDSLFPPVNDADPSRQDDPPATAEYNINPAAWQPSKQYYRTVESETIRKARNVFTRSLRQQERHDYPGSGTWHDVFRTLNTYTPNGAHRYRKSFEIVSLPDGVSAVFHGNSGAAVLEVMQRSGSHVQAIPNSSSMFSEVVLFGTMHDNTMAMQILQEYVRVSSVDDLNASQNLADYVLKRETKKKQEFDNESASVIEHDHPRTETDSGDDVEIKLQSALGEITASPVRSTWAINKYLKRPSPEQLLESPKITSALSLSEYVNDLVEVAPRLRRTRKHVIVSDARQDHISHVTDILVAIFVDQDTIKFTTTETLDQALRFLTKHGKYPEVRKISEILESNRYTFSASNYDVLFDAAAKATDLHNFRQLLKSMLRKGLKPTPVTWARFHNLMSRLYPKEAFKVMEAMRRKGLLANNTALVQVTHDAVERDLEPLIRRRGALSDFLLLYDRRFKHILDRPDFNWLSRDVMNRIAHIFLKAGRSADAYEVLAEFKRREPQAYVDAGTLSIFLAPAVKANHTAKLAVEVLRYFQVGLPGAVVPSQAVYHMLSLVAYRDCYFNMLRVVWRYACAAGHISSVMQRTMMASLRRYSPPEATRAGLMRCWGGKFAVGVTDGLRYGKIHLNDDFPSIISNEDSPIANGMSFAPKGELPVLRITNTDKHIGSYRPTLSPHERIMIKFASETELPKDTPESVARSKSLQDILEHDLQEVGKLKPVRPLSDMLEEAYKKDLAWKSINLGLARGLQKWSANDMFVYMMEDGIKIPMRRGTFASRAYTSEIPWQLEKFKRHNRLDSRHEKSEEEDGEYWVA